MIMVDYEQIYQSLKACDMQSGDTVFLHSDAFFLAQIEGDDTKEKISLFFKVLDDIIGPDGTLVLPVFTYSFTKGEPFDVDQSPSTVGLLSEFFRKQQGVLRSRDPIFSVAAKGKYAKEFAESDIHNSFGENSSFGLLNRLNGSIVCLGCSFSRITFTHFVEQKLEVEYRYLKHFSGDIIQNNNTKRKTIQYLVRDTSFDTGVDLTLLKNILEEKSLLKKSLIGRASVYSITTSTFFNEANTLLRHNPYGLIGAGQKK